VATDADLETLLAAVPREAGPFLADVVIGEPGWEDWLRDRREAVHGRLVALHRRLAERLAETGRHDEAAAAARTGLGFDPHDEGLHRLRLRTLDAAGRTGAAVREHAGFRDLLRAELGVDPSEETEAEALRLSRSPCSAAATAAPAEGEVPSDEVVEGPPVLAVHPFEVAGNVAGLEHLGAVMAGEIADELGRFHCLMVLATDGVFDPALRRSWDPELAHRVGATHAVVGRVRPTDDAVKLVIRLVELPSRRVVWSERYRGVRHDIFEVEEDAVGRIVATLFGRLIDDRVGGALRRPTQSLDAYDCVLRGISAYRSGHLSRPEAEEALGWFDRAIDLDPAYARAHAWRACAAYALWPEQPGEAHVDRNMRSVDTALSIDPTDSEANRIKGILHAYRREHESAERHLRKARRLNPNDARLLIKSGLHRSYLGDAEGALRDAIRARSRNPLHPDWYWRDLGIIHFNAGRPEDALRALALSDAGRVADHVYIAASLSAVGEIAEARRRVARLRTARPDVDGAWLRRALPFRCHRDPGQLEDLVKRLAAVGLEDRA
jgi:TolB-like protein